MQMTMHVTVTELKLATHKIWQMKTDHTQKHINLQDCTTGTKKFCGCVTCSTYITHVYTIHKYTEMQFTMGQ